MSESSDDAKFSSADSVGMTAGAMLKSAREKRGLHIAALAASIKVPQRKLEALECDRYEELLDLTFTRALAQTICRTLKIDAQPVLERLPLAPGSTAPKLQHVSNGLNAPFRERPGRDEPADWSWLGRPVFWATLLVLAAAAVLALVPNRFIDRIRGLAPVSPSASAATSSPVSVLPPAAVASSVAEVVPTVPLGGGATATSLGSPAAVETPAVATPTVIVPAGAALLGLKAVGETWVEVQDARGQTLLSRKVAPGESLGLDGQVPLRLTIGNATNTQVTFRGQLVDLRANTEGNVARLQLN